MTIFVIHYTDSIQINKGAGIHKVFCYMNLGPPITRRAPRWLLCYMNIGPPITRGPILKKCSPLEKSLIRACSVLSYCPTVFVVESRNLVCRFLLPVACNRICFCCEKTIFFYPKMGKNSPSISFVKNKFTVRWYRNTARLQREQNPSTMTS